MTRDDVITEELLQTQKEIEQVGLKPLKEAKAGFERSYIIQLMEMTRGNVSKASKLAGKYRADFYNLLKKHDITPVDFKNKSD